MKTCACGTRITNEESSCPRCRALEVLGLDHDATSASIENAYSEQAARWNPEQFEIDDLMRRIADAKFRNLNAAYASLSSKGKVPFQPFGAGKAEPETPSDAERKPRIPSVLLSAFKHPVLQAGLKLTVLVVGLGGGLYAANHYFSVAPATSSSYAAFKVTLKSTWSLGLQRVKETLRDMNKPPKSSEESPSAEAKTPRHARTRAVPVEQDEPEPAEDLLQKLSAVPRDASADAYVTLGLKPTQVAAILGAPRSASASELTYGSSVIYLNHGVVSGWNIDPTSSPLPVKIVPKHPADSDLDTFTVGSSKDVVIAVQGTPTLVTDSKFGYGKSQVYFDRGRVVGWMSDMKTVPLRVRER